MSRRDARGNRIARQQMQTMLEQIVGALIDEPTAIADLVAQHDPPTIQQVLQALYRHRLAREATDVLLWDLLAYARMAGATQQQIAEASGTAPTTVKARLSIRPESTADGEDFVRADGQWVYSPAPAEG